MLTLNQIKYKLIEFFNSHAQINQVVYSDDFDFNAERNLNYSLVNIEYLDSNISNRLMNHRFKFVIADLLNTEIEGHSDEIVSDCLQIAEDFFAWLYDQPEWSFNKSSSIQKFADDTSDRTSGVVFIVTLGVIRKQNSCEAPTH